MHRRPRSATRSRSRGSGGAKSGMRSRQLVQLDLVAERVEHIATNPAGDLIRLFRPHALRLELAAHPRDVVDAEREVPPWVEREIGLDREVDVRSARNFEPQAGSAPEGDGPLDLPEAQLVGIEAPGAGFLARRLEDLGVVERQNGHKTECMERSRSAQRRWNRAPRALE